MATFAARRLADVADNCAGIVAIELLAAAQGVELRAPLHTSSQLHTAITKVRAVAAHYDADRYFAPDIEAVKRLVAAGAFNPFAGDLLPSGG
jgi:histidine ammonia-lyase